MLPLCGVQRQVTSHEADAREPPARCDFGHRGRIRLGNECKRRAGTRRGASKNGLRFRGGRDQEKTGGDLLSHTVSRAVPSALRGLTAVFGMGTGVSLSLKPPECQTASPRSRREAPLRGRFRPRTTEVSASLPNLSQEKVGQASRAISTARLKALLPLHLRPINVVVYHGPSGGLRRGTPGLEVGFPLRCFQRLSRPHIATLRCGWRHNRHTSGVSDPVLSY